MDRPGKLARFGEVLGRAQQHRRMAVMTAGVHPAGIARGMRERVLLRNRQGIQVSTQRDRPVARYQSLERTDHPGAGDATLDRDAEGFEQFGNQRGGLVLFERDLRMGMDALPPLRHLGMKLGFDPSALLEHESLFPLYLAQQTRFPVAAHGGLESGKLILLLLPGMGRDDLAQIPQLDYPIGMILGLVL